MNDNTPKREIHRLAIALDGVNKGLEAKFCNGEPILTIHPDGRVTTSDKLKPDEIASAVLQMMKEQWLMDPQATKIRYLQARIKRLEDCAETAWGVIANVDDGGWHKQRPDWREAARRWFSEQYTPAQELSELKAKEAKP